MARTGYPLLGIRYRSFYYDIGSDIGVFYCDIGPIIIIGGHSDIGVGTAGYRSCSDMGTHIEVFDYDIGATPISVF